MRLPKRQRMPLNFYCIVLGNSLSQIASLLISFAVSIWLYKKYNSVVSLSTIAFFATAPRVMLLPLSGLYVDHWDKRKTLVICNIANLFIFWGIYFCITEINAPYALYFTIFIGGAIGAFQTAAQNSIIPFLVDKNLLTNAAGVNSVGQSIAILISPLFGGLVLEMFGIQSVIIGGMFCAILCFFILNIPKIDFKQKITNDKTKNISFFAEFREGLNFIKGNQTLRMLLLFSCCFNLFHSVHLILLTPLVLHHGSIAQLGYCCAIGAAGSLFGGACMTAVRKINKKYHFIIYFSFIVGLIYLCLGCTSNIFIFGALNFLLFFLVEIIATCSLVIWQEITPLKLMGRTMAFRMFCSCLIIPFSRFFVGPIVDYVFDPLVKDILPIGGISLVYFLSGLGFILISQTLLFYKNQKLELLST